MKKTKPPIKNDIKPKITRKVEKPKEEPRIDEPQLINPKYPKQLAKNLDEFNEIFGKDKLECVIF